MFARRRSLLLIATERIPEDALFSGSGNGPCLPFEGTEFRQPSEFPAIDGDDRDARAPCAGRDQGIVVEASPANLPVTVSLRQSSQHFARVSPVTEAGNEHASRALEVPLQFLEDPLAAAGGPGVELFKHYGTES